jgi:hypothetical protein
MKPQRLGRTKLNTQIWSSEERRERDLNCEEQNLPRVSFEQGSHRWPSIAQDGLITAFGIVMARFRRYEFSALKCLNPLSVAYRTGEDRGSDPCIHN